MKVKIVFILALSIFSFFMHYKSIKVENKNYQCKNIAYGGQIGINDSLSTISNGNILLGNFELPSGNLTIDDTIVYRWLKKENGKPWVVIPEEYKSAYNADAITANRICFIRQSQLKCDTLDEDRWIGTNEICIKISNTPTNFREGDKSNNERFTCTPNTGGKIYRNSNIGEAYDLDCHLNPGRIIGDSLSHHDLYQWEIKNFNNNGWETIAFTKDYDPPELSKNTCLQRWTRYYCSFNSTYYYYSADTTICINFPCKDCPDLGKNIGESCDDGDDNTFNDLVSSNCNCSGTSNKICPEIRDGGKIETDMYLSVLSKRTFFLNNKEYPSNSIANQDNIIYRWLKKENHGNWFEIPNEYDATYQTDSLYGHICFQRQAQIKCDTIRDDRWIGAKEICMEINPFSNRDQRNSEQATSRFICHPGHGGNIYLAAYTSPNSNCEVQIFLNGDAMSSNPSYQWEKKGNSDASWSVIAYTEDILESGYTISESTSFRRFTWYDCNSTLYGSFLASSNVNFTLNCSTCSNYTSAGSIRGNESSCGSYNPGNITSVSGPSGGTGGVQKFQWESLSVGGSWREISGAIYSTYNPGTISSTVKYRRGSRRDCQSSYVYSNEVTKTVSSCCNYTSAGSIRGNESGCGSYNPGNITSVSGPSGGTGGAQKFQWESLSVGGSWREISGAIYSTYNPGTISSTVKYRRGSRRDCQSSYVYSNEVTKTVSSCCNYTSAGSIRGNESGCGSYNPGNITSVSGPSGGTGGAQKFQWESLSVGGSWREISGAIYSTYNPGTISSTVKYRRGSRRDCQSSYVYSNEVTKTVSSCCNYTSAGSIRGNESSCGSYNPGNITSVSGPSGGTGGAQKFQWESLSVGGSWREISGAIYSTYNPGTISSTVKYRRGSRRDCQSSYVYSNEVTKTVSSCCNYTSAGSIRGNESGCGSYNPGNITSVSGPSGGTGGAQKFQWESLSVGGSWREISGAIYSTYNPGTISSTVKYRRGSRRDCQSSYVYSNEVTKTVSSCCNYTSAGSIRGNESSCGSYNPGNITSVSGPSGGTGGAQKFQWESLSVGGSWREISGAIYSTYNPGTISSTVKYRRGSRRDCQSSYVYSNEVTKTVSSCCNYTSAGSIRGNESGCGSYNPGNITSVSGPSGGTGGAQKFQWESLSVGGSWREISGAIYSTYNPGTISSTVKYRRGSRRDCQSSYVYSNEVTKTVSSCCNYTSAGSISGNESGCGSYNPGNITSVSGPSGGTGGAQKFQWESLSVGGSWREISGAIYSTYNPGTISSTVKYRRGSRRDCQSSYVYSNEVTKTVSSCCNYTSAGSIRGNESGCGSYNPGNITSVSGPSGGTGGAQKFQWESLSVGGSWREISGAIYSTYNPGTISSTVKYRRGSRRDCQSSYVYSNEVTKTVSSCCNYTSAGSIRGNESGCGSYNPGNITSVSGPSGGTGGAQKFQWESLLVGGSWREISGAIYSTYNPGTISSTVKYRRGSRRDCQSSYVYSNEVTKTVSSCCNYTSAGSISGNESGCGSYNPGNITSVSGPSGGTGGAQKFQWESLSVGGSWTEISGAIYSTYNPGTISSTVKYRRGSRRDCQSSYVYSNEVTKTVISNSDLEVSVNSPSVCGISTTVTASRSEGTSPYSYSWSVPSGVSDPGNDNSFSVSKSGTYRVTITDGNGCTSSSSGTVTLKELTSIQTHPQPQIVDPNTNTSFSVAATGTNLTYQWQKNGVDLVGGTTATLDIDNVVPNDVGIYKVIVKGDCGTVPSNEATLQVNGGIVINQQPTSLEVCPTEDVQFYISATADNLAFQWYKNDTIITNAIDSILVITDVEAENEGNYKCILTGDGDNSPLTSAIVTLTLKKETNITKQATDVAACTGETISFEIEAEGVNNTYKWLKGGTPVANGENATLSISDISAAKAGTYTCEVIGDCGTKQTSSPRTLTILPETIVTTHPSPNTTICPGESAIFSIVASGDSLTYQWYKNDTLIDNQSTSTLTISEASYSDAGSYVCKVNGTCGNDESNPATLNLEEGISITNAPISDTVCLNGMAEFSIETSGEILKYEWLKDGTPIANTNNATFQIANVETTDVGEYTCEITGKCGFTETSTIAELSLITIVAITQQPDNVTICLGEPASFEVAANIANAAYQWQKDGVNIAGATSSTFVIDTVKTNHLGNYVCVISDECVEGLVSGSAVLQVDDTDTDADGIIDCIDSCPELDDNLIGTACNDLDSCTVNDVYTIDCDCVGERVDENNDGIDDYCGECVDVGKSCSSGACMTGETIQPDCSCGGGTLIDTDEDGVCDTEDNCLNTHNPDQTDTDGDGIGDACDCVSGASCVIADTCYINGVYDDNCNCIGQFADADGDGVCDREDLCPEADDGLDKNNNGQPDICEHCDANEHDPTLDFDGDTVPDCEDECPYNSQLQFKDSCGCGTLIIKSDTVYTNEGEGIVIVDTDIVIDTNIEEFDQVTIQGGNRVTLGPGFRFSAEDSERFRGFIKDSMEIIFEGIVDAGDLNGNQIICAGEQPSAITSLSPAINKEGLPIAYKWEFSSNNEDWQPYGTISTAHCQPEVTASMTYFRRLASIEGCTDWKESRSILIEQLDGPIAEAGADQTICQGQEATLIASGGIQYRWSTGDTIAQVVIRPNETRTYTVTVTDINGCKDTDDVTINVGSSPQITLTPSNTICPGDSIELIVSGGSNFLWDNNDTTSSIKVSPLTTTNYSVTVTEGDNCEAYAQTTVFIIEEWDTVYHEIDTLCVGVNQLLTVGTGDNYQWSNGETSDSINPLILGDTSITVSVTGNNGCPALHVFAIETFVPATGIGWQSDTICEGDTIQLMASGGVSYNWHEDLGFLEARTIQNPKVAPLVSTSYYVDVMDAHGCVIVDTFFVEVLPFPRIGLNTSKIVSICSGETITLINIYGDTSSQIQEWRVSGQDSILSSTEELAISPSYTTEYELTAMTVDGRCYSQEKVIVQVLNPGLRDTLEVSICTGDSTTLNSFSGQAFSNHQWTPSIGLSQTNVPSPMANPSETTIYKVYYDISSSTGGTCSDSLIWKVNVHQTIQHELPDTSILQGDSIYLAYQGVSEVYWSTGETETGIWVKPDTTTTYIAEVIEFNGCTAIDSTTVSVDSLNIHVSRYAAFCFYDTNYAQSIVEILDAANFEYDSSAVAELTDSIPLSVSGGTTYLWSTGKTTSTIYVRPTETTTYTVTGFDNVGNSQTDTVTVFVNYPLDIVTVDTMIQLGDTLELYAGDYSQMVWSTGASANTIRVQPTKDTTFGFVAVPSNIDSTNDESYCLEVGYFNVQIRDLVVDAGPDVTICQGDTATLMVNNAESYVWNTGDTTTMISVNPTTTTTYTVVGTNEYGQTAEDEVTVIVLELPVADSPDTLVICQGDSIQLSASAGISYEWTDQWIDSVNVQSPIVKPIVPTPYTVKIENENGCFTEEHFFVDVKDKPILILEDKFICSGESVTFYGPIVDGYEYEWSKNDTIIGTEATLTVAPLINTAYTLKVINTEGGCFSEQTVLVAIDEIAINGPDYACQGQTVTLSVGPFTNATYLWSTGDTTDAVILEDIQDGIREYWVEVTQGDGCRMAKVNKTVYVSSGTVTQMPTTFGCGTITLTAPAGNQYIWSPTNDTTQSIMVDASNAATYTVEVKRDDCNGEYQFPVESLADISIMLNKENPTCAGNLMDGKIMITVPDSIDSDSLEFSLDSLESYSSAKEFANLLPGTYTVFARYQAFPNCFVSEQITLDAISDCSDCNLIVGAVTGTEACPDNDNKNGTIVLSASTTQPVEYKLDGLTDWSEMTAFRGLAAGTYTVLAQMVDSTACDTFVTAIISPEQAAGTPIDVSFAEPEITICSGESVTLNPVLVGVSDYFTFNWTELNTSNTLSNTDSLMPTVTLPAATIMATYKLVVTDTLCNRVDSATVKIVQSIPAANAGDDQTITIGDTATLTASGGTSYLWNNDSTTASIQVNPSATTIYWVAVTNDDNCTASDTVLVTVEATTNDTIPLSVSIEKDTTICKGETVTLTATGGTYYQWSNGNSTPSITVSPAETTSYTVTATDDNNGYGTAEATVTVIDSLAISITASTAICLGESISLEVYADNATYLWDNDATDHAIRVNPVTTTTYSVAVTDTISGCNEVAEIKVTVLADGTMKEPIRQICAGDSTTLMATGGVTYIWKIVGTTEVLNTTAFFTVSPSDDTNYEVEITNDNDCIGTSVYPVEVLPTIPLSLTKTDPTCNNNQQDGSISITSLTTIDNQDLEFRLTDGTYATTTTFTGLAAGSYTIFARYVDDTTCVVSQDINLTAPTDCAPTCELTISAEVTPPDCEGAASNGLIVLTANDVNANMAYKLDDGSWQSGLDEFGNLVAGTYTVTGRITTDITCIDTIEVIVPEPLQPCDCDTIAPVQTCNANLVAGDIAIIGFDNDIGGGADQILLTNLVDLAPNASFSLTTAIYGVGSDTTTLDQWLALDGSANVAMQTIVYDGESTIPAGSVLCFELPASGVGAEALAHTFSINGQASEDFCVYHTGIEEGPVNLQTDAPTTLFVLDGVFEEEGNHATFCGNVVAGLMNGGTWKPANTANPSGSQESTIHPHLDCFIVQGAEVTGANAAYYNGNPPPASNDAFDILSALMEYMTWTKGAIPASACEQNILPEGD